MATQPDEVMSGARMKLYVNGIEVARSTNIRFQRTWQNARVDVHGSMPSVDIESLGYTVTLSCATVYLKAKSMRAAGITPPANNTRAAVLWPAMSAMIFDEVGETAIARIEGLKPQSEDFDSPAKGLITYSGGWEGTELFLDAEV